MSSARRLRALLAVLLLLLGMAPARAADPLTGRAAAPTETAVPVAQGLVLRLAQAQRGLNDAIAAAFRQVRDTGSRGAMALILGLAFLYGVLHAIGPGHGKAVVASYFVANHARWTSGIVMGSLISLIQGATAILLVGLLAVVLQWRQFEVLNRATLVEFVSYALIALLGAVMLWRGIAGHGCADHGAAHDRDRDTPHAHDAPPPGGGLRGRLVIAAGLTPCASAIIILLFALANEALLIGIAAVASLSLGMAITVSVIGVLSVLGRRAVVGALDRIGLKAHRLEQGLSIAGAVVIVAASGLMMAGAWARL